MHRFSSLVAVMAFLLILTGTLASGSGGSTMMLQWTGHLAGSGAISDPPAKYSHVYQLVAVSVLVLTILMAFWLWISDSRRYIKTLAGITVGVLLVLAVGLLIPGLSVFSLGYDLGIQAFFGLTVCLALFTRTDWRWDHPKTPDVASPSVRQILVFMTGALFLQSLLGEGFHRGNLGIAPHLVLGIVVTLCAVWVLEMALNKFAHSRPFKMSAILLAELVGLELFLGIISYSMGLDAGVASAPQPGLLVMQVTHAAVGALVLATSLFTTFQAFKYLAPAESVISLVNQQRNPELDQQQE